MSYVTPCFCADRVMLYPREGVILAQATGRTNLQHNLFHLDLVLPMRSMGQRYSRRMLCRTLNGSRVTSIAVSVTYQVTIGSGI